MELIRVGRYCRTGGEHGVGSGAVRNKREGEVKIKQETQK